MYTDAVTDDSPAADQPPAEQDARANDGGGKFDYSERGDDDPSTTQVRWCHQAPHVDALFALFVFVNGEPPFVAGLTVFVAVEVVASAGSAVQVLRGS